MQDKNFGVFRLPASLLPNVQQTIKFQRDFLQIHRRYPTIDEIAEGTSIELYAVRGIVNGWRVPVSYDKPTGNGDGDKLSSAIEDDRDQMVLINVQDRETSEKINKVLDTLSLREREIIKLMYGRVGGMEYTLE